MLGLALVGSWACGRARQDFDVDLLLLVSEPKSFVATSDGWPKFAGSIDAWSDGTMLIRSAWSRHVRLQPACEIEFTFCDPSWAATDPVDPGTATVVSGGCRRLLDKAGLFEGLLAVTAP